MVTSSGSNNGSHVVSADQLGRAEPGLRRLLGFMLWVFSLSGNVLAFTGDNPAMNKQLLVAIAVAIGYQFVCSVVQFITCKRWYNPLYLIALAASAIPSFIGYRKYIAVPIAEKMSGVQGDIFATANLMLNYSTEAILWGFIASAFVFIILVAVDVIPERIFVRH
jgi:hypothetical protein